MIRIPQEDDRNSEIELLIATAKQGTRSSLGELLSAYHNYLMIVACVHFRPRLRPRTSPADMVQETMLRAIMHFGQFRGTNELQLQAWLRRILVNVMATFIERHVLAARRDRRREVSLQSMDADAENGGNRLAEVLPAIGVSPDLELQQNEEFLLLAQRLSQLSDNYRQVLILRNLQELPFEVIAKSLNRSVPATRMLWVRAIEKLRHLYETDKF